MEACMMDNLEQRASLDGVRVLVEGIDDGEKE
jgi:hypothetical protein